MQSSIILLNSNENTRKIEDEEKSRFIKGILNSMSVPLEGLWEDDIELSIENRIKLRNIFSNYNIKIIESPDGEVDIYVDNDLIAEWKKPRYVLKRDIVTRDPEKKLYLEMHISYNSVFDDV